MLVNAFSQVGPGLVCFCSFFLFRIMCITLFRSITVYCETDSIPQNVVMDLNNIMCVRYLIVIWENDSISL